MPTKPAKRIHDCKAVANMQPPGPYSLRVTCKVKANEGQTAKLVVATPQGINPAILLLDLIIEGRGAKPADIKAEYKDKNYKGHYRQVSIKYGSEVETCDIEIVV